MIESGFKLPRSFYDGLFNRLHEERNRVNGVRRNSWFSSPASRFRVAHTLETVPNHEHLTQLVEIAFWTSLQREEGRHLSFSVGYEKPSPSDASTFSLLNPLAYNQRNLTKVAPAIGSPKSCAIVSPNEKEELEIWGVRQNWTTPFTIKVLDPGQLIIHFARSNVAAISGSEAVLIRYGLLNRSESIWSAFKPQNGEEYSMGADPRVDTVLNIVRAIRRLGHGGALIIVPDDDQWRMSVAEQRPYDPNGRYTPAKDVLSFLQEAQKNSSSSSSDSYVWCDSLERTSQSIAQLSAVDGAVIISPDLDVLGFGVMLNGVVDDSERLSIMSIDPLDHSEGIARIALEKSYGARHQSAARFVLCQKRAVAIVVSQDGNVTAFVWEVNNHVPEGHLVAYRRLELTLF